MLKLRAHIRVALTVVENLFNSLWNMEWLDAVSRFADVEIYLQHTFTWFQLSLLWDGVCTGSSRKDYRYYCSCLRRRKRLIRKLFLAHDNCYHYFEIRRTFRVHYIIDHCVYLVYRCHIFYNAHKITRNHRHGHTCWQEDTWTGKTVVVVTIALAYKWRFLRRYMSTIMIVPVIYIGKGKSDTLLNPNWIPLHIA